MATLTASAPVLLSRDVLAAADYWRDKLGFAVPRFWGEPPQFCIPERNGVQVMLVQAPARHTITPHWRIVDKMWNAYFYVHDIEALYAELIERGATIDYALYTAPHGTKEFGVQDWDGHDLAFGELL